MSGALFVFDLKGDKNVFHHTRLAAAKAKRVFKYLIVDSEGNFDTYNFPPFQMAEDSGPINVLAITETLIQGLNMQHGAAYGSQYFSQQSTSALLQAISHFADNFAQTELSEVSEYLKKHTREFKDASEVRMTFELLSQVKALSRHSDPDRNIDLRKAILEGHVIYIWTRTLRQSMTARLVAGLILYSVIAVSQGLDAKNIKFERIIIIVDEFQTIVSSEYFGDVMAQCGSFMSLVLACQSSSQLKAKSPALKDFVMENASIHQLFTCMGDDIEELQALSKDKIRSLGGTTVNGLSTSVSFKDTITTKLERDTILETSATFGRSFLIIDDGTGHKEPIIMQQKHEYPDLSDLPMPVREDEPLPAREAAPAPSKSGATERPKSGAKVAGLAEKIAALIEAKRAAETWRIVRAGGA